MLATPEWLHRIDVVLSRRFSRRQNALRLLLVLDIVCVVVLATLEKHDALPLVVALGSGLLVVAAGFLLVRQLK